MMPQSKLNLACVCRCGMCAVYYIIYGSIINDMYVCVAVVLKK